LKDWLPPPKVSVPRLRAERYPVRRQVAAMLDARGQFEEIEVLARGEDLARFGPTRLIRLLHSSRG